MLIDPFLVNERVSVVCVCERELLLTNLYLPSMFSSLFVAFVVLVFVFLPGLYSTAYRTAFFA